MKIREQVALVIAGALVVVPVNAVRASEHLLASTEPATTAASNAAVAEPLDEGVAASRIVLNYSATYATKYLFQGVDYSEGEPVVQPQIGLAYRNLSASVWLNHDLNYSHTNEYDFTVQYAWSAGGLDLSAGYMYLTYPHREGWDPSQEILVAIEAPIALSPSFSIHYDFDAGRGSYSTAGVSQTLALPVQPLTLATSLYYQNNYYEATGFPSWEMNLSAERAIGPLTLTPAVSRIVTWENGDFRGDLAVPRGWLVSVNVAQEF